MSTQATTPFNGIADPTETPRKGKQVFLRSEVTSWPIEEFLKRRGELSRSTVVDDMGFTEAHMAHTEEVRPKDD